MLDIKLTFGGAFCFVKYSYEQRLETVKLVTERHMSIREAARYLGTDPKHARRWVRRYEQFGAEGLLLKNGTYTGDFKQHVIEYMHENHLSTFEAATLFRIPTDTTIDKWERIYYEEGPTALYRDGRGRKRSMSSDKQKKQKNKNEENEDLLAEVQRLRMENAYLKKLNALVQERIARESGRKQPPSTN